MVNSETESRELSFFPSVYALAAVLGVAPGAIARLPLNEVGRQIAFKASAEFINPSQQRLDFSNAEYEVAGGVASVLLIKTLPAMEQKEAEGSLLKTSTVIIQSKYVFLQKRLRKVYLLWLHYLG